MNDHRESAEIPASAGVGLRAPHLREVFSARPALGFFEVHAENYLGAGPALTALEDLRRDYPLSVHGVGVSLGSASGIDREHLNRFRALIDRTSPFLVSEHLAWSIADGVYLNDLLPLPYTEEALDILARNVDLAQDVLGRPILIENPSRYLAFRHSPIPETEFLTELHRRTGCGLLCDVNNIFVTCRNLDLDPDAYLDALPPASNGAGFPFLSTIMRPPSAHRCGAFTSARSAASAACRVSSSGTRICPLSRHSLLKRVSPTRSLKPW
jgi:uncharacterized protein